MFNLKSISGIDIGNSEIKSAEFSNFMGRMILKKFSILKNDTKSFQSGEILNTQKVATLLKSVLKKQSKAINFGMSGAAVMVKKITIPQVSHELIPEQLRWEAEQYVPFDIEQVNLDYIVLKCGDKIETLELLLIAAQQNKVAQYVEALKLAGMTPLIADVSSFALANCFLFNYPEFKSGTFGIIDAGAFFTHFVVIHNGEIIFCRDIPGGGQRYDDDLARNLGVPIEEAEHIKRSGSDIPDLALDTIQKTTKSYADQILGSVEFFRETTEGFQISNFFVTGGASLTLGLMEQLGESLGSDVQYMDVLRKIKVSSKVFNECSEEDLQYKSAVSLGLALRKGEN